MRTAPPSTAAKDFGVFKDTQHVIGQLAPELDAWRGQTALAATAAGAGQRLE